MNLDTSPQIKCARYASPANSPDSLPDMDWKASNTERAVLAMKDFEDNVEDPEKLSRSMELDDLIKHDGDFSITADLDSISSQNRSFDTVTEVTDLLSPKSNGSPPDIYTRAQVNNIPEEPTRDIDLDDNGMPDLEDIYGTLISPPSPPPSSNKMHINCNALLNLTDTYYPKTVAPSSPRSSNESILAADTITNSTETEKGDPPIQVSWFVWPPESLFEKDLCERVCEEVAIIHGFQTVAIKSNIITRHIKQTWDTTRYIKVDPYLIATFSSIDFSPYKRCWEKIVQTADIHVGPEGEKEWERWGVWRKGNRAAVVWRDQG